MPLLAPSTWLVHAPLGASSPSRASDLSPRARRDAAKRARGVASRSAPVVRACDGPRRDFREEEGGGGGGGGASTGRGDGGGSGATPMRGESDAVRGEQASRSEQARRVPGAHRGRRIRPPAAAARCKSTAATYRRITRGMRSPAASAAPPPPRPDHSRARRAHSSTRAGVSTGPLSPHNKRSNAAIAQLRGRRHLRPPRVGGYVRQRQDAASSSPASQAVRSRRRAWARSRPSHTRRGLPPPPPHGLRRVQQSGDVLSGPERVGNEGIQVPREPLSR